ncbi:DUF6093 family protein [Streptomyces pseudovenezuelae]|uniref:DUF6093 family protein n=1 Tax=Streptomyces pseudovenezuelae TaxID=67350 RepID=UPI0036ED8F96
MALDFSGITKMVEDLIPWDTVRICTPSVGARVFNPDTGLYTYPQGDPVYEGPGAVQTAGTAAEAVSVPGANLPWAAETRSRYRLLTPLSAPVAEKDMLVTVIQIHEGGDLALLDRQWRVQDPGGAGTINVLRITALDQVQQGREATR